MRTQVKFGDRFQFDAEGSEEFVHECFVKFMEIVSPQPKLPLVAEGRAD